MAATKPTTQVPSTDIIRVKATVTGDPVARIVLAYVNLAAPNEDFELAGAATLEKLMQFDEEGLHSVVFVAVGNPSVQGATFSAELTNTDDGDAVVVSSGAIAFKSGVATWQRWLRAV